MNDKRFDKRQILDDGRVRMQWSTMRLLMEELPRRPNKIRLRALAVSTWYAVESLRLDAYRLDNLIRAAALETRDSYELVSAKLRSTIDVANLSNPEAERRGAVAVHEKTTHYLAVTPEDA